ncbi:MAG: hypothetical protein P1R58_01935 [bacterium]|nr:hypothetical protein [bacterium]
MRLRLKHALAVGVCLLLFVGLNFGSFGGVLCVGGDGHLQVEPVCEPGCNEDDYACLPEVCDSESEDHQDCKSCSDLPLEGPVWHWQKKKSLTQQENSTTHDCTVALILDNQSINYPSYKQFHGSPPPEEISVHLISTSVFLC